MYACSCGHRFGEELGKYGCPCCCGDSGPAMLEAASTAPGALLTPAECDLTRDRRVFQHPEPGETADFGEFPNQRRTDYE
jgi:hypothetical protein